ncbi:unnamed protein product [Cuscuta campestris]|uniref:Uncharacterized protein n=1 Tax=Cuscuta campestris TaxID=132261 RepID=A0A484N4L1_9ASTE|nr:unnamed protein product [Cuscuta campestris]
MKKKTKPSRTRNPQIRYKFLKPGDLAQIRNSRIKSKSRTRDAGTLISLLQENRHSSSPPPENPTMEDLPCFDLRIKNPRPRCLLSKKLFAVSPVFSQSRS